MDKRLEKIENYIRQYHMIEKGDRIVIGVSGGADSVCLLMALCSLQEKLGFQVLVCHVNHELRGEEAAQDEAYVEMLCHKMQVPFFAFHENVEHAPYRPNIGICRFSTPIEVAIPCLRRSPPKR